LEIKKKFLFHFIFIFLYVQFEAAGRECVSGYFPFFFLFETIYTGWLLSIGGGPEAQDNQKKGGIQFKSLVAFDRAHVLIKIFFFFFISRK
jgi:hypothetical protein